MVGDPPGTLRFFSRASEAAQRGAQFYFIFAVLQTLFRAANCIRAARLQNETAPEKLLNRYEKQFEKREKRSEKRSETQPKNV